MHPRIKPTVSQAWGDSVDRMTVLAETFQALVDELPSDWTDLVLDLRIDDENRYIDASVFMTQCNAQPYSRHDWHWRINVAHTFGHAAGAQVVHGTLRLLDDSGITGDMVLRDVRVGRAETVQMWGRPDSVEREFRARRSQ